MKHNIKILKCGKHIGTKEIVSLIEIECTHTLYAVMVNATCVFLGNLNDNEYVFKTRLGAAAYFELSKDELTLFINLWCHA